VVESASQLRAVSQLRRGLRRNEASAYVGFSATKFDQLVTDGRMPKPLRVDGCVIWDVRDLDVAFDALKDSEDRNPWDREATD
jgi:predicted DNA-binding transcriptional regulator AlpA